MREATTNADAQDPTAGVVVDGVRVTTVAYADDLVLFAKGREELARRIASVRNHLQLAGLSLNASKSKVVSTVRRGKTCQIFVHSAPLAVGDLSFPAVGPGDIFRYLGVDYKWSGPAVVNHRMLIHRLLEEVQRAPLKPHQRLHVIRVAVLARFFHQLVLGRVHGGTLAAIDRLLRRAVRRTLRLPEDTPVGMFHARVRDGGLGVPSSVTSVPLAKRRRLERLLSSNDGLLRAVGQETAEARGQGLLRRPVRVGVSEVTSTGGAATAWRNLLYSKRDGAGLRGTTPLATRWISEPSPSVNSGIFIKAVQLRAGVLATGTRSARGRGPAPLCRGPCGRPESLNHLLQGCALTHGPRVKRHDNVVRELVRRLRRKQANSVIREPIIPCQNSFIKPDILVVTGGCVTVIDVAVTSDGYLLAAAQEKRCKYGTEAAQQAILRFVRRDHAVSEVRHLPFVLTWRGLPLPSAAKDFRRFGVSARDIQDIVWLLIRGSLVIYSQYFRSTFLV